MSETMVTHNLKQIRQIHGLSCEELGTLLGVDTATVYRNEAARPSKQYVRKFCDVLHVDAAHLVGGYAVVTWAAERPATEERDHAGADTTDRQSEPG